MSHRSARLTVHGRRLLVERVCSGRPVAHVAAEMGISRVTAHKWMRRWRAEGEPGLHDRSSRPLDDHSRLAYSEIHADEKVGHLRRLPHPRSPLLPRPRHHPHRTRSDRQRLGLPQGPGLEASPRRDRRHRQAAPHLPPPDQRQGRTLPPHPARRVGLPKALHQQPRAHRSPDRLPARLQLPSLPHRTRRPATHHPSQQRCGSIHLRPVAKAVGAWLDRPGQAFLEELTG